MIKKNPDTDGVDIYDIIFAFALPILVLVGLLLQALYSMKKPMK
ncbi:hypothetical protein ACFOUV_17555 [Oceanobacillus longus]|uniref:Uncharacterized protein n=1 Tax=Oceanobacillus longus TaxID=930120 RepID=A0ABV8H413_9BACI